MYTVLLVDDEIWSLEGIRKLFAWEKEGFTVIGQTTDAAEAFDILRRDRPDVVITDIRMPEISGVELLAMSREQDIQSEFVILSGFAEFEYAREALRYGAFDYHLKPIDPADAGTLLGRLKLHLKEKRQQRSMLLMKELTGGLKDPAELMRAEHFRPIGTVWQAAACFAADADECERFAALFADLNHLPLRLAGHQAIVICNGGQSLEADVRSALEGWPLLRQRCVGLSGAADEPERLAALVREADMAAHRHFVDGRPGIAKFTAASGFRMESAVMKLEKWLLLRNEAEIRRLLDGMPDIFVKENLGLYHAACLWNQFAAMMRRRLATQAGGARVEFLDYDDIAARFPSLSAMCAHIAELLEQACRAAARGSSRSGGYNGNFLALLEYVNGHYDKELSLGELAERFYLNMSYCSELFRKVTGYTFSDYVTRLRMETAAELLQSGRYTATRVCQLTGYNDYYYFSKIFKRYHGIPPSQFASKLPGASSSG